MPNLEHIIKLFTLLFLLSMVNERVADFLKHYLCGSRFFRIGDTLTKHPLSKPREDQRYFRILKINILSGIIIATILKADMVNILSTIKNADAGIGWEHFVLKGNFFHQAIQILLCATGIILTGCLISFGSKFWHDLLDILYAIKNVKRYVSEPATSQDMQMQRSFDLLSPEERDEVLKTAIYTLSPYWENTISNYKRVAAGKKIIDNVPVENTCITFYVSGKGNMQTSVNPVPEYIFFSGFKIPTDVENDTGIFSLHHDFKNPGDGTAPASPGESISRTGNKATGTISLKVTSEGKTFILSCYHVLFDTEYSNGIAEVNEPEGKKGTPPRAVKIPGDAVSTGGTMLGKIARGKINHVIDAGIAELTNETNLNTDIDFIGRPNGIYQVKTDDVDKLTARFCGARSGLVTGKLIRGCHAQTPAFESPIGTHFFTGMIQIEKCSVKGDSGAPVTDQYNRLIGIIEGSDDQFTYIIPIHTILHKLKVSII